MPPQRGLKVLLSVLGFPSVTGAVAYTLSGHYGSLMNFDGTYFLVKATQELYDTGIPKVPKDVQKAVEWILARKEIEDSLNRATTRQRRDTSRSAIENQWSPESTTSEEKSEIFADDAQEKKYWCRYFDYSGGKDNVIMQYDPLCTLYNVFDFPSIGATLQQASHSTTIQTQRNKQLTIKLDEFQEKTKNLESKRLKSNSEFKRGAFYVLKLNKNKIPNVNSTFTIEITKPGNDKWRAEKTYQPKISAVRIQAQLTGDPSDSVKLTFADPLPSSRLLVKKINDVEVVADSPSNSTSSSPSSDDEEASYYFKNEAKGEDKLYVEHVWSFNDVAPSQELTETSDSQIQKFDLTTLDKELLKNFGAPKKPQEASSGEKHYLFKNVSDFWPYKAGDTISLYKLPKSKSQSPEQEKKLGTFQVISGVLVNLSSTLLRCVSKEQYEKQEFKPNLRTVNSSLIDISRDVEGEYCRKDDPTAVLILVGYNGDIYKKR